MFIFLLTFPFQTLPQFLTIEKWTKQRLLMGGRGVEMVNLPGGNLLVQSTYNNTITVICDDVFAKRATNHAILYCKDSVATFVIADALPNYVKMSYKLPAFYKCLKSNCAKH